MFRASLDANKRFIPGQLESLNQSIIQILLVLVFSLRCGIQVLLAAFFAYTVWNTVFLGVQARCYFGRPDKTPLSNPAVRSLLHMIVPLLVSYSLVYVNQLVDKILVSSLPAGTVTAMGYGATLSNLVGTFIAVISSVLFSYMASDISQGKQSDAAETVNLSALLMTVIFLPVSILTILCSRDVVSIVYGRGAFSGESIDIAARALSGYGFLFLPLIFRELFSRFQYAYQDSRWPMLNSSIGIAANIVLSIALCPTWGVFGVAFASSVSVLVCSVLNLFSAKRHNESLFYAPLLKRVPLLCIGGVICFLSARWGLSAFSSLASLPRFLLVTLCSGGGYLIVVSPIIFGALKKFFRDTKAR